MYNSRKIEKYCDLGCVIYSLGYWSNDNYILKEELYTSKRIWKELKRACIHR